MNYIIYFSGYQLHSEQRNLADWCVIRKASDIFISLYHFCFVLRRSNLYILTLFILDLVPINDYDAESRIIKYLIKEHTNNVWIKKQLFHNCKNPSQRFLIDMLPRFLLLMEYRYLLQDITHRLHYIQNMINVACLAHIFELSCLVLVTFVDGENRFHSLLHRFSFGGFIVFSIIYFGLHVYLFRYYRISGNIFT